MKAITVTTHKTLLNAALQSGKLEIIRVGAPKPPLRLLVTGGRNYADADSINMLLSAIHERRGPITCIIHGGATGADTLAKEWALAHNIKELPYPADWDDLTQPDALIRVRRDGKRYDARAGFRRNQRMIDEGKPTLVAAFPGGNGTADMSRRARQAGLHVVTLETVTK
jgi:hypothetical protein